MASFVRYPWGDAAERERPRAHEVNEAIRASAPSGVWPDGLLKEPRSIRFEHVREPVKFEAGQVVRATYEHGSEFVGVLSGDRTETYHGPAWYFDGEDRAGFEGRMDVISPAPRRGDTWSNGESVASIAAVGRTEASGAQLLIVSEGEPFIGDVVAVARRLWEGGYRRANPLWSAQYNEATRAPLPRAGDVYEDANGTVVEIVDSNGRFATEVLHSYIAWPCLLEATRPENIAMMLRDRGYVRVSAERAQEERRWANRIESAADEALRKRCVEKLGRNELAAGRQRIDATTPQSALDGLAVPSKEAIERARTPVRATLAFVEDAVHVLREGMIVRREPCELLKRVAWGRVISVTATTLQMHWLGDSGPWKYGPRDVADFLRSGRWRIVDPDVHPLASLAAAVAAIFTRPDIATSRRYIDQAIRSLRGEPFAAAVTASLVAAGDDPLSPHQIAALVRGARAHEARRSVVASARRVLTDGQLCECFTAARDASGGEWHLRLSQVYERARTA